MPRLATTFDVFNAVAEPQRRSILTLLTRGELPVNEVAEALHLTQPQASKHLRVLREVQLVRVRGAGQQRYYRLDGARLEPVHAWVQGFAQFWNQGFDRLDDYLEELQGREPPR